MTGRGGAALYSPEMLALAVELHRWPFDSEAPWQGTARSPSCGSAIAISLSSGDPVGDIGLRVSACAVGQAAAALFARSAAGMAADDLRDSRDAIADWLAGDAPLPEWPGLALLAAMPDYPGRHGAMLLPWNAALDALSKPAAPG